MTERSWRLCPRHADSRDGEGQGFTAETGKEPEVKAMGGGSKGRLTSDTKPRCSVGSWHGGVTRGVVGMVCTL